MPENERKRQWILRPPRTPDEDPGGTSRPVVSTGPPIEEWITVVPEADVERLREQLAVAAPPEGGPVVAVPVRELNDLRTEVERLREENGRLCDKLARAYEQTAGIPQGTIGPEEARELYGTRD